MATTAHPAELQYCIISNDLNDLIIYVSKQSCWQALVLNDCCNTSRMAALIQSDMTEAAQQKVSVEYEVEAYDMHRTYDMIRVVQARYTKERGRQIPSPRWCTTMLPTTQASCFFECGKNECGCFGQDLSASDRTCRHICVLFEVGRSKNQNLS